LIERSISTNELRMGTEYFCRHVIEHRKTYGQLFKEKMTLTPDETKGYLQQEMFDRHFTAFTFQVGRERERDAELTLSLG